MLPINITEHNAAMWGLRQDEIDLVHGRSEYQKWREAFDEWRREKCMSGEVFEPMDVKLREFVANHLAHAKDAADVRKYLDDNAGTTLFVKLAGETYEVSRNYSTSWELPVQIRKAKVIEV
jgi:hypothetical protein